jgi:mRNA-degrading endonuclease RelE of RelBE toxin-antitoxin system
MQISVTWSPALQAAIKKFKKSDTNIIESALTKLSFSDGLVLSSKEQHAITNVFSNPELNKAEKQYEGGFWQ